MEKTFGNLPLIVLLSCTLLSSVNVTAQNSEGIDNQVWFDYEAFRIPREHIQFMGDAGYRFLVGGGWEKYLIRPSLQRSINEWLELFGGIGFFYTVQTGLSNTLEIRPWVGAKINWYWDSFRKIGFSDFLRIEDRFVINTQSSGTSHSVRLRNKISVKIPITNHYFVDNTLYTMLSVEFFLDGGDIKELYADKIRLGVALGYKFNYTWRVEYYFYEYRSENTATSGFTTTDQVWQLILKHYID